MANVINLRQARKRAARANKERKAEENRVRFGRTKAKRALAEAKARKASRDLDAHRREPGDE